MVFTAVLAAIAVIATMVTVPGTKAQAAEPADFVPNTTLGNENFKEEKNPQHFAADYNWGLLVWAGKPAGKGFGNGGNDKNDVGWAWCVEPIAHTPLNTREAYEKKNATKLKYKEEYHDAVINLARKMEAAAARGDSKSAANYYVYLLMFYDSPKQNPKNLPYETIIENSTKYFPAFTGSHEEFTELTGYKIEGTSDSPELVKDPETEIAKQPADAFITVVHPNNNRNSRAQSVIPVDQPGLPKEKEQDLNPKISTNADFEGDLREVVAGAKVVDEVSYEGLVPGKEYTLKAELINKEDGKSVLGTGEKTFTPEKSEGVVSVTITVNDDVTEPVEAAVAFEKLTSAEVNDKGEETPDATSENPNQIAEHKDINDKDQTVTSEVDDQDNPGGSSKGEIPWWLILIPGIGLGKIIMDRIDHNDHGNQNGGRGDNNGVHGDNTSRHDGGNDNYTDGHNGGNGHEANGQGQRPEETGNALPSNAGRVVIKSVPSGATELEPGMQDYIK